MPKAQSKRQTGLNPPSQVMTSNLPWIRRQLGPRNPGLFREVVGFYISWHHAWRNSINAQRKSMESCDCKMLKVVKGKNHCNCLFFNSKLNLITTDLHSLSVEAPRNRRNASTQSFPSATKILSEGFCANKLHRGHRGPLNEPISRFYKVWDITHRFCPRSVSSTNHTYV